MQWTSSLVLLSLLVVGLGDGEGVGIELQDRAVPRQLIGPGSLPEASHLRYPLSLPSSFQIKKHQLRRSQSAVFHGSLHLVNGGLLQNEAAALGPGTQICGIGILPRREKDRVGLIRKGQLRRREARSQAEHGFYTSRQSHRAVLDTKRELVMRLEAMCF